MISNYFDNLRVSLAIGTERVSKRTNRVCPNGFVLGPTCWNLMFDGSLLRLLEASVENKFIAYTDALLVLVTSNRKDLEIEGQRVVDQILGWCRSVKLELSTRKSEVIMLKSG